MPNFSPQELDVLRRAIADRRSLGLARLKPDPIDPALIQSILEAANWGQSNDDTEPWRYIVFSGEGRRHLSDAFAQAYLADTPEAERNDVALQGYKDRAMQAPVWIAIGMTPKQNEDGTFALPIEEELLAVGTSVQNLGLMASALGLAGMWHSRGTSAHPAVAKALGFEPPSRLLGLFYLGWPNVDWPAGERRPLEEKVRWMTE